MITGQGMAVVAAAAMDPLNQFMLLQRGAEWDEMLVVAPVEGFQEHVVLTTTADGSACAWAAVRLTPGNWV